MLTPEQLHNMRDCANDGMPFNANTILMLLDHIDAQQARIAELYQDAAAERERIKAICDDVIDEWFNCAGGADEVLRRIEEYEQNGEAKP